VKKIKHKIQKYTQKRNNTIKAQIIVDVSVSIWQRPERHKVRIAGCVSMNF